VPERAGDENLEEKETDRTRLRIPFSGLQPLSRSAFGVPPLGGNATREKRGRASSPVSRFSGVHTRESGWRGLTGI